MIPKKPVPDAIRDGHRFSEKIMRKQTICGFALTALGSRD